MKVIARAVILLSITFLAFGCGDDKQPSTDSSSARDDTAQIATADTAKMYSYEVLNTVEYTGSGSFSQQAAGVMAVNKQPLESGQVAYTYSFVADTSPDGGKTVGQITLPAVTILRDPQTERIVGGTPLLKNLGRVANGSLNQIDGDLPLDGTALTRSFHFDVPEGFPQDLSYKLTARPQTLETGVKAVAVLAVSEPFKYRSPGDKNRVTGQHRVLCLLTADTADVLYLCNNFIARAAEQGDIGELRIESLMVQLQDGKPISLAGLDAEFTRDFERLRLSETEAKQVSDTGLPLWAMHSLAVRDMADITAGAAIEGAPNFAVVATVGMVLLADSVVSTSTGLLHEAGVIDWEWKGLPNYAGRGVGLAAAKGFERATGKDASEEKWMDVGGLGGDVAALLIPSKVLGAGVKLGSGGVKILKGQQLAGKSLRLSKHGLDLVRTASGWQRSAKTVKGLMVAQDLVNTVRLRFHPDELAEPKEAIVADRQTPEAKRNIQDMNTFARLAFNALQQQNEAFFLNHLPTPDDLPEMISMMRNNSRSPPSEAELQGEFQKYVARLPDATRREFKSFQRYLRDEVPGWKDSKYVSCTYQEPDDLTIYSMLDGQPYEFQIECVKLQRGWVVTDDIFFPRMTSARVDPAVLLKVEAAIAKAVDSKVKYALKRMHHCLKYDGTVLSFSRNGFTTLPPEIGYLTDLTKLDLSHNDFTALPPEIGKLTKLTELDLSGNRITTLPPEIGNLTELNVLDVYLNELTTLPPDIGKLSSLKELSLKRNRITTLPPEIGNLTELTELDLTRNKLTMLPPEIGKLTNLTALRISHNEFTKLPPEIGKLTNLTKLDLSVNVTNDADLDTLKSLGSLEVLRFMGMEIPKEATLKRALPKCKIIGDAGGGK